MQIKSNYKLLKNMAIILPFIGLVNACAPTSANADVEKAANASSVMHMSSETKAEIKAVLYDKYLAGQKEGCLLYTSPSPRDRQKSRMPSSA